MTVSFILLLTIVLMANSTRAQSTLPLTTPTTSCPNYDRIHENFYNFNVNEKGVCYTRLATGPHGGSAGYKCAYRQIGYTGPSIAIINVITGSYFYTQTINGQTIETVMSYQCTRVTTSGSSVASISLGLRLNMTTVDTIVNANDAGYIMIRCPTIKIDTLLSTVCSLPYEVTICTYERDAPRSDIDALVALAADATLDVYNLVPVDQSCTQTNIVQNPIG